MAQFYSQAGHVPVHQVSSIWGLKPLSLKYQYICQVFVSKLNYAWMIPVYLADMEALNTKSNLMAILESLSGSTDDDMDHLESDHGEELPMETSQEMDHASRRTVVDGIPEVELMGNSSLGTQLLSVEVAFLLLYPGQVRLNA